jgi:hypothetical protein
MTAFFDDLRRKVMDLSSEFPRDEQFVEELAKVEARVVRLVGIVIGDREFPKERREKILQAIALLRVCKVADSPPIQQQIEKAAILRGSQLLDELHSQFHNLASMRTIVRFGLLTDKPDGILKRRDDYDGTDLWAEYGYEL